MSTGKAVKEALQGAANTASVSGFKVESPLLAIRRH